MNIERRLRIAPYNGVGNRRGAPEGRDREPLAGFAAESASGGRSTGGGTQAEPDDGETVLTRKLTLLR